MCDIGGADDGKGGLRARAATQARMLALQPKAYPIFAQMAAATLHGCGQWANGGKRTSDDTASGSTFAASPRPSVSKNQTQPQ